MPEKNNKKRVISDSNFTVGDTKNEIKDSQNCISQEISVLPIGNSVFDQEEAVDCSGQIKGFWDSGCLFELD